jgi:hypothetical protein
MAAVTDKELWRVVPSFPEILASSHGRVMLAPAVASPDSGQGRKQYGGVPTAGGWDGKRFVFARRGKTHKVARLVCEAFNGPPPSSDSVCMHLDEDSRNNRPGNLRWGSQKENLNAPGFLDYCRGRTGENSPIIKGRERRQVAA